MSALTPHIWPGSSAESAFCAIRGLIIAASLIIGIFVLGLGTWSALAPLHSAAIAPGTVVSSSHRKTVQHLEPGIVATINVRDGDAVRAGQTLIRLDDTRTRATLASLRTQHWDAKARAVRLAAERDGASVLTFPPDLLSEPTETGAMQALSGQQRIFETRRSLLASKLSAMEKRIAELSDEIRGREAEDVALVQRQQLLQGELNIVRDLTQRGLERRSTMVQLMGDLVTVEGQHGDAVAGIARAREMITETEINIAAERNDWQRQIANELRETEKTVNELEEQIRATEDILERLDIKAPESGIVTDLHVHTPSAIIGAGEALLDLVPSQDQLVIEAHLAPKDIDRVRVGLPAQVRLLPYNQRRVPPIDARVIYVSADRLLDKDNGNQPYYAAKLRVDATQLSRLEEVRMVPGMPAEAMIQTGVSTVAFYALSPLVDSFRRAFREP